MKLLNTLTTNAYHDLIDYNVVDQTGDHVGTLHSLWSDQNSGALEFLGVKTGWLFGKNHVVPADKAQIDEENRFVQIPFAAAFIKEAPSIAADAEITEEQESEIHRYYSLSSASNVADSPASGASFHADPETTINDLGRAPGTTGYPVTTGTDSTAAATTTASSDTLPRSSETAGNSFLENPVREGKREIEAASMRLRKVTRPEPTSQDREPVAMTSSGYVADPATGSNYGATTATTGGLNPDPITGEPGAHPIGTGIGAASGAATGAAMGLAGGPIGAVIGGVVGAVTGGLVGKGVEEYFDPTEEAAYWRENHRSSTTYDPSFAYEDVEPAYRTGYTGFGKYHASGKRFEDVEDHMRRDYEGSGASLTYDKARNSVKAAYDRLSERVSGHESR